MRGIIGKTFPLLVSLFLGLTACGPRLAADPVVTDKINWPAFLSRHDLLWDLPPTDINTAPIIGNGGMSASIRKDDKAPLSWQVYRIDVTDHREPVGRAPHPLFDTCRLAIGRFYLLPVGKVLGSSMRLQLWDAVCTGELKTDKGTISWRTFVPRQKDLIVVDFTTTGDESGFTWKWMPYPSSSTRWMGKEIGIKKMTPDQLAKSDHDPIVDGYQPNPDVVVQETSDLLVSNIRCWQEDFLPWPAARKQWARTSASTASAFNR